MRFMEKVPSEEVFAPTNPEKKPLDLAEEYAGPNTPYSTAERALQGGSRSTGVLEGGSG